MLAAVSVHGFVLSVALGLGWLWRHWGNFEVKDRRRILFAAVLYAVALILIAASAWPPKDVTFVKGPNLSLAQFLIVVRAAFREAFTGNVIASLVIVGISLPFLWRGGSLPFFAASVLLLCALGSVIYTHLWHFGLLFLAWVGAIWMAATSTRPTIAATGALLTAVLFQCYWAASALRYDWTYAYSGSKDAANFIAGKAGKQVYGLNFSTTSLQPYFAQNRFANFNGAAHAGYWDWSARNRNNDPMALFSARPDYIVAGYKANEERTRWTKLVAMSGYTLAAHFEGGLFWRTRIEEPEGFDIYVRSTVHDASLESILSMNDPSSSRQLVTGFHDAESNAWRWTAREFGVVLKRPEACVDKAALLTATLFFPEDHLRKVGRVTLRAQVGKYVLPPEVFGQAGRIEFARDIPLSALDSDVVAVSFRLDRAAAPSAADARELGIIVERIGLQPNR